MSERRRRKNPRFLKETSDRSGFDSWSRNREGNFSKKWTSVKQSGLLLEPEEYDMAPPSNKPLGGADISGSPRANSLTTDIPSDSQYITTYLVNTAQVEIINQSPMMITGSNNTVTIGNYGGNDTYTKLLLHGDSNPIVDSEETPKTVTTVGTVYSTTKKVFGTGSLAFDGTNSNYLTLADSDDWSFGTGDFTIDCWIFFNVLTGTQEIIGQYADANNYIQMWLDSGNNFTVIFKTGGTVVGRYSCSWAPIVSTWYHIAFERTTTTAKFFVNGESKKLTETTAFGTNDVGNVSSLLYVGILNGTLFPLNGYIDELRISKGIARWKSNFALPNMEYKTQVNQIAASGSNNTLCLLCVGSDVTISSANNVALRTTYYVMNSGSILNLIYDTGTNTWQETSRDHQYYGLGNL